MITASLEAQNLHTIEILWHANI